VRNIFHFTLRGYRKGLERRNLKREDFVAKVKLRLGLLKIRGKGASLQT